MLFFFFFLSSMWLRRSHGSGRCCCSGCMISFTVCWFFFFFKSGDRCAPSSATQPRNTALRAERKADRSWRAAGRKLSSSPAAPPASAYELQSLWPKMRRCGTRVKELYCCTFFPPPPSNKQGLVSDEARVGVVHPEKTKTTLGWLRQKRPLRTKFTRVLCATLRSKRTDVCVKND